MKNLIIYLKKIILKRNKYVQSLHYIFKILHVFKVIVKLYIYT